MKIYLIGLPGSGKTTLGRQVAEKLAVEFVDLDVEIERQEGKAVPDIFKEKGEDYFRLVEAGLLKVLAGSSRNFVMATGGGAPCFYDGIDVINATGLSVFLKVPVEEIFKRINDSTHRPLLLSEDSKEQIQKLKTLESKRLAIYEKAAIIAQDPTIDRLLELIEVRRKNPR